MKKGRLFISMCLILVIGVIVFALTRERVDYESLVQVNIKVMGTMVPNGDEYMLTYEGGQWSASHNEIVWLDDNISEAAVDAAFVDRIIEILEENKVHQWDNFSIKEEIEKQLGEIATDGINYSFYMLLADGTTVTVKEYNHYPETFMSVFNAFEEEFEGLFPESE